MELVIMTREELNRFKAELVHEIAQLLLEQEKGGDGVSKQPQGIRSREVRRILGISPATLQNLRIGKKLSYVKVGGTYYYDYKEIQELFKKFSNR